jgi:uncharacterized protein YcaQ
VLSADDARRLALTAQGLTQPRPTKPTSAHVLATARRLQAVQIDAVNVVARGHYLPFFSRLGPYPTAALDRLVNERHELVELRHAHQASYVPVELEPLLRCKLDGPRHARRGAWRSSVDPAYVAAVEDQVRRQGPLTLSDLDDARRRPKLPPHELTIRRVDGKPYAESSLRWGRPSDGKTVLDGLLHDGVLALAGRRGGNDRLYDLAERVLPAAVRDAPTPPPDEARRELVRRAAVALGVATAADLAGYFELKVGDTKRAIADLVDAGALERVDVATWWDPAFLALPPPKRTTDGVAGEARLLGPFDSLTWSRDRTRRLFGFEFSFEIYVPEPKRRYGYYVLPVLLDGRLVARVDLRADRPRRTLVVLAAHPEPTTTITAFADPLTDELDRMASWLGLEQVELPRKYGRRP